MKTTTVMELQQLLEEAAKKYTLHLIEQITALPKESTQDQEEVIRQGIHCISGLTASMQRVQMYANKIELPL